MKRSEMIKKICLDVDCIRKTEFHEATNECLADLLLKHLEEYGMLPPEREDIAENGEMIYGINEWEDECY